MLIYSSLNEQVLLLALILCLGLDEFVEAEKGAF